MMLSIANGYVPHVNTDGVYCERTCRIEPMRNCMQVTKVNVDKHKINAVKTVKKKPKQKQFLHYKGWKGGTRHVNIGNMPGIPKFGGNTLRHKSLLVGRGQNYFTNLKTKSPAKFEYIYNLCNGDLVEGHNQYEKLRNDVIERSIYLFNYISSKRYGIRMAELLGMNRHAFISHYRKIRDRGEIKTHAKLLSMMKLNDRVVEILKQEGFEDVE